MKLVIYTGNCSSIVVCGKKFTKSLRTHIIEDDQEKFFMGQGFMINNVPGEASEEIVVNTATEEDDQLENDYTSLKVTDLKELCEERKIEFTVNMSKTKLIELLMTSDAEFKSDVED